MTVFEGGCHVACMIPLVGVTLYWEYKWISNKIRDWKAKRAGAITYWEQCSCGWWSEIGKPCRNSDCPSHSSRPTS